MLIAIDDIHENGNMRRTLPEKQADEALSRSIAAIGVLEPVLVRPNPEGGYLLIAGYRRVKVARSLGLKELPAEVKLFTDVEAEAAQAAENMVRAAVDPVDQWRHICRLIDDGYSKESAGAALGLSDRRVGQLSKLGRLAPAVLDCLIGKSLPPWKTLGEIAQAPHDRQIEALNRHRHDSGTNWNSIAAECIQQRIPRDYAIFDVEASGIEFEEDMFAEPGSPEQFTTTQLLDFMRAQRDEVEERIRNGKEPAILAEYNPISTLPKMPAGWTFADYGEARTLTKRSRQKRLYSIIPANEYRDGGKVISILIKSMSAGKEPDVDPDSDEADPYFQEDAVPEVADEPDVVDGEQITKAGHDMLASIRENALKDRLRFIYPDAYDSQIMAALIVQLVGHDQRCRDLVAALIAPDGNGLPLQIEEVAAIGAEALARTVEIWPKHNQIAHNRESMTTRAEWIGALVEADLSMPRLDTREILAHVGGEALKKIATDFLPPSTPKKSVPKKVGDLRQFLVGKAEAWRPVHFGAPGPNCAAWHPENEADEQDEEAA
ncbi:ParB/RepB/Spo0J family partition protein [Kozakia baliensis]|uniref:ParB-like N-terminal domain-containing protein n=1 Tax=Kozakia baliensis TaxID=153496 RepID=A0A1D8UTK4_9PROT|nr:ParB/RepB/Spo0J family partition protein [Kozakia baliensis]AOX16946.1 hypothetical protein A0U89_07110 [Kozakia baliensis]GBR25508.1 chromosome partitioning nuclease protein [Kozakia baliensis NRIC 0488]GEL64007.1 hypothetical protein KBA01_12930 [Kozakia baliensis]